MNAELDKTGRVVDKFRIWCADFSERKTETCFFCGKKVVRLEQIGRCVYSSCGCRLWKGKIPEAWKTKKNERSHP